MSDHAAVHAFVDGIVAEHGRIDIAFANAGVARGLLRHCSRKAGWTTCR